MSDEATTRLITRLRDESCGFGIGHALLMQEAADALERFQVALRVIAVGEVPFDTPGHMGARKTALAALQGEA